MVTTLQRILLVEPIMDKKVMLMELLKAVIFKCKIEHVKTMRQAGQKLTAGIEYEYAFFPSTTTRDEFLQLLNEVKVGSKTSPPSFVVNLRAGNVDTAYVADMYTAGVHGFIREPYSSDELKALMEAARNNQDKVESAETKGIKAGAFLVTRAVEALDQVALRKNMGHVGGGKDIVDLREVCESLKELYKISPEEIAEQIFKQFSEAKPLPQNLKRKQKQTKPRIKHPGEEIKELMVIRSLSLDKILSIVKISKSDFEAILNKQKSVDEAIARELARALGKTSNHWVRAQKDYDAQEEADQKNK